VVEKADECEFWLEFIIDEKLSTQEDSLALKKEAHELTSIFASSRRKARGRGD
jgi:hypothetical protein